MVGALSIETRRLQREPYTCRSEAVVGKKLAREQSNWNPKPRGRRRVRSHVRHAADRAMIRMLSVGIGLVLILILLERSL